MFSRYWPHTQNAEKTLNINAVNRINNPPLCSDPIIIDQRQSITTLKKFVPIRDLDDVYIESLEQTTLTYTSGAVIFKRGKTRDAVLYLLKGRIELQPDSDNSYIIADDSSLANLPLNSGRIFGATAIAQTDVTLFATTADIIKMWTNKSREQMYSVKTLDIELPEQIANTRFFTIFSQAYRDNKLNLPSLPNVAIKLKEAMREDIGVNEAVEIIQIDAPIVTKLIQITNSPLYASVIPITNCHDAVTRIGLNATRNLVMSISMKQLFQCKEAKLIKIMKDLWRNSLYVSSLCFVLAEESGAVNPEDALLAGLISNIGVIPILHFAEKYPDEYADLEQLQAAIPFLSPSVGSLVLHALGFTDELINIPLHAEDWLYESEGEILNLIDIVILARLHSYIGTPKTKNLPYINSIPAYTKLKNGKLTPEFSLNILQKTQKRVITAMRIFS